MESGDGGTVRGLVGGYSTDDVGAPGKVYIKNVRLEFSNVIVYNGGTDKVQSAPGLVPRAMKNEKHNFLKGDGTWGMPPKQIFYGHCSSDKDSSIKKVSFYEDNIEDVKEALKRVGTIFYIMMTGGNTAKNISLEIGGIQTDYPPSFNVRPDDYYNCSDGSFMTFIVVGENMVECTKQY